MLDRLNDCWSSLGMHSPVLMPNLKTDKLWQWMAEFPEDERIGVLPGETVSTIVDLLKAEPDCAVQAHAGNGIVRVCRNGRRGKGEEGREKSDEAGAELPLRPEIRLMRAIKERFDPKNILKSWFPCSAWEPICPDAPRR